MSGDMILLKKTKPEDCLTIAKIHRECLPESFLGSLGVELLAIFYKELCMCEESVLISAEDGEEVVGFISGVTDTKKIAKKFTRENFFEALFLLLPNLPKIRGVFEDLRYLNRRQPQTLPEAELLSLATIPSCRSKGVASELFKALVEEFRNKNITDFKCIVGATLKASQGFYKKMGGVEMGEFELHRGSRSTVYVFR